jgi:hypothetical protein
VRAEHEPRVREQPHSVDRLVEPLHVVVVLVQALRRIWRSQLKRTTADMNRR